MALNTAPILVASCGNSMAADDAFGPRVNELVRELHLPDVEVVELGMQPCGLLHRLEDRQGLVVVDAAQASAETPAGMLLDLDFLVPLPLQLLHDVVLSSHALSIADELELAKKLDVLPPCVRLVAATVETVEIGRPMTPTIERLLRPAAQRVARITRLWSPQIGSCGRA